MKPTGIDFAKADRPTWWGFGLAAAGLGCAVLCGLEVSGAFSEEQALQIQIEKAQARVTKRTSPALPSASTEMDKEKIRAANVVIADIDKPWAALLNALELSGTDHASLLSVEPDGDRRELKLLGEARNAAAAFAFLRTLSAQPAIESAHLVGHQINAQDAQRPLRFTVQASWKPVSAPPPRPEP